jgi:hypothetical protein
MLHARDFESSCWRQKADRGAHKLERSFTYKIAETNCSKWSLPMLTSS